jgi:hypothetical protein
VAHCLLRDVNHSTSLHAALTRPALDSESASLSDEYHAKREWAMTTYMVIERFKNGDAIPVYRRVRDQGRLTPPGLGFVTSWVDLPMKTCFQVMQTEDRALLDQWIAEWSDLVDFEVYAVTSSAEAGGARPAGG